MTSIHQNHHSHHQANRSRRSGGSHHTRRHSRHDGNRSHSNRHDHAGNSRRGRMRSHMGRIGNRQSQQLHAREQHCRLQQHQVNNNQNSNNNNDIQSQLQNLLGSNNLSGLDSLLQGIDLNELSSLLQQEMGANISSNEVTQLLQQFGLTTGEDSSPAPETTTNNNTNNNSSTDPLAEIQALLQGFNMGDLSSLLGLVSADDLSALLQQESGMNVSANEITQLLQQLGLATDTSASNDPLAEIQALLQGFNMGDLSSLLGLVSADDLSALLQQESGMNVSTDEITQLLQQLGLATDTSASNDPIPVEPDNGIGDGADPLPPMSDTTSNDNSSTDPLAEIQALLQGFNMGDLSSLLGLVSADDLSALLQQESGMNVSADEITQLLQQLGLATDTSASNDPIPVEPDNGIGDGAGPLPPMSDTTSNDNSSTDPLAEIQTLLQGFNMGDLSSLLGLVSADDLSALLQQESGMNVSADEITQLLQQLGLATDTSASNDPIPVEPGNGIGDGAGPLPPMSDTTNNDNSSTDPLAEIQTLLQGFNMGDLSSLLGLVSADDLSALLQQESGMNVSADEITQLLQQLGLATDTSASNDPIPVEPDNGIGDGAGPLPPMSDTTNNDNSNTDPLAEIQALLQGFNMGDLSSLLGLVSADDLSALLQQESGMTVSADEITQLLQQLGLATDTSASNDPIPVEPDNGIGDGAGPLPPMSDTTNNDNSNTDPLAEIQALLQGFNMGDLSSLLGLVSADDLSALLQQESGMTVSADEITQLLQQLGLATDTSASNDPIPVEPDNGIGDGAGPLPPMPDTTNNGNSSTDPLAEIQTLLQGFNMGDLSSLLGLVSADDLSALLQQESGMNVSADEITQLLQQLGLATDTSASNDPIPVEPDNGIGDGAGPLPPMSDTTSNDNSSTDPLAEIQALLQGFNMGDLSSLLGLVSADDLSALLQQESGMTVSADEITQLLQQLGLATDTGNDPIPVEPDNGIGDGAGPLPPMPDTTSNENLSTDPLAEIQTLLQSFDMGEIGSLLQLVDPDELSTLLQQESGLTVSGNEITQLLQQLGLTTDTITTQDNSDPIPVEGNNGNGGGVAIPPTVPPINDSDIVDNTAIDTSSTPATTTDSASNTDTTTNSEVQSLLQGIDSNQFSAFFDIFSPEQLAEILRQEGTDVSASEVQSLLAQLGV